MSSRRSGRTACGGDPAYRKPPGYSPPRTTLAPANIVFGPTRAPRSTSELAPMNVLAPTSIGVTATGWSTTGASLPS